MSLIKKGQIVKLKYGKKYLDFTPFENVDWSVLEPTATSAFSNEMDLIHHGVDALVEQLERSVKSGESVLCVIPDHTRKCRLPLVLPELINAFKSRLDVEPEFLVANGSHVLQPESIVRELVGDSLYDSIKISQHDAKDDTALSYVGDTTNGTRIYLNTKVVNADHLVTIGGILFHYFAGFGGGPKMLLPGVAGYETIRQNHSRTIDPETGTYHKDCTEGNIDTNPVYLDLKQALDFFDNIISLQFALDTDGKIVMAKVGPVLEAQRVVCAKVRELYTVYYYGKADVVVAGAGGFPSDVNLVQSHKAIFHAYQAVKSGGVIIAVAACEEGAGSATFMPYFEQENASAIGQKLLTDYKINGHTALSLKSKAEDVTIILVSGLDEELVKKTGMVPAKSIGEAVRLAKALLIGDNIKGYVLSQANLYVPEQRD